MISGPRHLMSPGISRRKSYDGTVSLAITIAPVLSAPEITDRPRSSPAAFVRSRVSPKQTSRPTPIPNMLTASPPVESPSYSIQLQRSAAEASHFRSRHRARHRIRREREPGPARIEDWVETVAQSEIQGSSTEPPEQETDLEGEQEMGPSKKSSGSSSSNKMLDMKIGVSPPETVRLNAPLPYPLVVRIRVHNGSRTISDCGNLLVAVYLTNEDKINMPAGILGGVTMSQCQVLPADCAKSLKDGTQGVAVLQNLVINAAGDYRLKLVLFQNLQVVDQIITKRFRVMEQLSEGNPHPCEWSLCCLNPHFPQHHMSFDICHPHPHPHLNVAPSLHLHQLHPLTNPSHLLILTAHPTLTCYIPAFLNHN